MDSYAGLFLESVQNKIGVSWAVDIIVPRLVVEPLSLLVLFEGLVDPLAWISLCISLICNIIRINWEYIYYHRFKKKNFIIFKFIMLECWAALLIMFILGFAQLESGQMPTSYTFSMLQTVVCE